MDNPQNSACCFSPRVHSTTTTTTILEPLLFSIRLWNIIHDDGALVVVFATYAELSSRLLVVFFFLLLLFSTLLPLLSFSTSPSSCRRRLLGWRIFTGCLARICGIDTKGKMALQWKMPCSIIVIYCRGIRFLRVNVNKYSRFPTYFNNLYLSFSWLLSGGSHSNDDSAKAATDRKRAHF